MIQKVICKDVFGREYPVAVDDLEQRVAVYVVIIEDGKILLTRQWDGHSLIGGGIEKGEALEDAVAREVKEETGLNATPGRLIYHTTTFFQKDGQSVPWQSFQFYFTHGDLSGEINNRNITDSERKYTNDIPEWVDLKKADKIVFRHSVDLKTVLDNYYRSIV
jgi:8-oxo-dGTP pyrophosphatase MutT (NUDIX family)